MLELKLLINDQLGDQRCGAKVGMNNRALPPKPATALCPSEMPLVDRRRVGDGAKPKARAMLPPEGFTEGLHRHLELGVVVVPACIASDDPDLRSLRLRLTTVAKELGDQALSVAQKALGLPPPSDAPSQVMLVC